MEQCNFKNSMRDIFAAHGKTAPTDAMMLAVWKRVADRPDAFMEWAAAKLADYDKLPGNLGLELSRELYPVWRTLQGNGGTGAGICCPECEPRMPGYFYGWARAENGYVRSFVIRCLCNGDPALGNMPRMSREYAESKGFSVMPAGYPGGPASFERETFQKAQGGAPSGFGAASAQLAEHPEYPAHMRPAHVRQLAEAGA